MSLKVKRDEQIKFRLETELCTVPGSSNSERIHFSKVVLLSDNSIHYTTEPKIIRSSQRGKKLQNILQLPGL